MSSPICPWTFSVAAFVNDPAGTLIEVINPEGIKLICDEKVVCHKGWNDIS